MRASKGFRASLYRYLAQVKPLLRVIHIGIQVEKMPEHEVERGFYQSLYPRFLGAVKTLSEVTQHISGCMIVGRQKREFGVLPYIPTTLREALRWRKAHTCADSNLRA